ncbi:MAG: segregation/condensation protein A [Lentisphaerae bacterium]|nr:segregation/condensation protein A [Lentisphaerota bacterium]
MTTRAPSAADEYKVDVEVFEGPLDLLLYLIRKDELEICDIEINRITSQYVEYLGLMRMLDLTLAGEFIVMAATLMMIKSRMLLPVEERPELEDEEEDPRWDLVRQLLEYKKFKDAARHLDALAETRANRFARGGDLPKIEPEPGVGLDEVSLFDLIAALNEALKRVREIEFDTIVDDPFTVSDKIEEVLRRTRAGERFTLSELFGQAVTRNEISCAFLAVLELIRLRQIRIRQAVEFGEIEITALETGGRPAAADAGDAAPAPVPQSQPNPPEIPAAPTGEA